MGSFTPFHIGRRGLGENNVLLPRSKSGVFSRDSFTKRNFGVGWKIFV